MLGESPDYTKLQASTGIDFDKIKAKYASRKLVGAEREADAASASMADTSKVDHVKYSNTVLDKYKVCHQCNGTGLHKTIYNFMTLESNCEVCDGEGVLFKPNLYAQSDESVNAADANASVEDIIEDLGEAVSGLTVASEVAEKKLTKMVCFDCGSAGVTTGHEGCKRISKAQVAMSDSEEENECVEGAGADTSTSAAAAEEETALALEAEAPRARASPWAAAAAALAAEEAVKAAALAPPPAVAAVIIEDSMDTPD